MPRIGLPRKRAKDLTDAFRRDERSKTCVGVAGVVVDNGEIARALRDQRVDQRRRHARIAEAADHDRRAVGNVGERGFGARESLIDHGSANYGTRDFFRKHIHTKV